MNLLISLITKKIPKSVKLSYCPIKMIQKNYVNFIKLAKFKEVQIAINYAAPKTADEYLQRMALVGGTKQRYSVTWASVFEESKLGGLKEIYEKVGTEFPASFEKMKEAVANEASDEDKKAIYDESFGAIKEEKFSFKLPRGTKKTKAPPAQTLEAPMGGNTNSGG